MSKIPSFVGKKFVCEQGSAAPFVIVQDLEKMVGWEHDPRVYARVLKYQYIDSTLTHEMQYEEFKKDVESGWFKEAK